MPQNAISQFTGHSYTTSETALKYRTTNSGNPLAHDDVDANIEILRKAVNGLVADVGLGVSNANTNYNSLLNQINTTNSNLSSTSASLTSQINSLSTSTNSQISTINSELSSLETSLGNDIQAVENQVTSVDNRVTTAENNNSFVPTGAIMPFAGSSAPSGWLLCNGGAVSRSTYSSLFSAISTIYGTGNGSSTFNLPDLRGRVVAGVGASGTPLSSFSLGSTGGNETEVLSVSQIPQHQHAIYCSNDDARDSGSGSGYSVHKSNIGATGAGVIPRGGKTILTALAGGSAAHNNTQPTIALNYIIKT